jgi:hypothetical protein
VTTTRRILTALERLETKQGSFEAALDKMGTDAMAMRAAAMNRIDRLQHKVDHTHDALVVNFGNTDRLERIARAAVHDGRTTRRSFASCNARSCGRRLTSNN